MTLTKDNSPYVVVGGAQLPWITDQPVATTAASGAAASFTALGKGQPEPTVQWQVSDDDGDTWSDITSATDTTYTIDAVSDEDGNLYRAVFTNDGGSQTSESAELTVTAE